MKESGPSPTCSRCGTTVAPGALQGLCPRCLLALNLATQTDVPGDDTSPGGTHRVKPPVATPPPEEIAKHFPQLEILECLGQGGMGAVYRARQPKLERIVALKILLRRSEDGTADPSFAERFAREARALAKLNHPDIVAVYDYGEAGGYPYLVMEYVDGLSLRQLLQQGRLASEQALVLVPKICEALQFAHHQGVVHRDIKPENILLDKEGRVKIADFGIAKILAPGAQDLSLTGGRDVVGTPHYMAPEQMEQPAKVDHRADIFSLGVVFYEMLTGELPLGKFAPPSKRVQVDVRLDEVVLHALEKDPQRRYQHASQVKTDVETIAATPAAPGSSPADSRELSAGAGTAGMAASRRRRRAYAFAIAGLILIIGFIVWLAAPKHPDYTLTGRVISAEKGDPIFGATVTVKRAGESSVIRDSEADVNGCFTLVWPHDADLLYWRNAVRHGVELVFEATAEGYEAKSIPLFQTHYAGDYRRAFDFRLQPAGALTPELADDITSIRAEEKLAGRDSDQRFFLIAPSKDQPLTTNGYSLLLLLPGYDGSAEFLPFVKRISQYSLSNSWLIAELVAPQWDREQAQKLVWPTEANRYPGMRFSTEAFIHAVIGEVEKQHRIDPRRIFTLTWSSSSSAGYAASLYPNSRITGSFIAMSVFKPQNLPDLEAAQGRVYYLLHSPEDRTAPFAMATRARDALTAKDARVKLVTYEGGHGWHGDVYSNISDGIRWLEQQVPSISAAEISKQDLSNSNPQTISQE